MLLIKAKNPLDQIFNLVSNLIKEMHELKSFKSFYLYMKSLCRQTTKLKRRKLVTERTSFNPIEHRLNKAYIYVGPRKVTPLTEKQTF